MADVAIDILGMVKEAALLLVRDDGGEYDLREFIKRTGLYRIHDYETMGNRTVGTFDCGSVKLVDTPKSLYRALYLFAPERLSFKSMYKTCLLTLTAPDQSLVATVELFKYELALYYSASKEHVEGHGSNVICGAPGYDNGIRFKGEVAEAWFGFIKLLLTREWDVYGGNNFQV